MTLDRLGAYLAGLAVSCLVVERTGTFDLHSLLPTLFYTDLLAGGGAAAALGAGAGAL